MLCKSLNPFSRQIKFLQSYPTSGSSHVSIEDDSITRYESTYEDKIDPFNVFSKKV